MKKQITKAEQKIGSQDFVQFQTQLNLLPVKRLKARKAAVLELVVAAGSVLGILGVCVAGMCLVNQQLSAATTKKLALEAEKKKYDQVIKAIADLNKQRDLVAHKIGIIDSLKRNSTIAVRLLDDMVRSLDHSKTWFTGLSFENSRLEIKGFSLGDQYIAEFTTSIGKSESLTAVNISKSETKTEKGRSMKEFQLTGAVKRFSPPAAEAAAGTTSPKK